MRYGFGSDHNVRLNAAAALREIDDTRALAGLLRAIPSPTVTANVTAPNQTLTPAYSLPIGPLGARMPLFLPQSGVAGTAADIGGPVTDLLKLIARKDFGNLPPGWVNWYREKTGEIGTAEREAYREHRPANERMNLP